MKMNGKLPNKDANNSMHSSDGEMDYHSELNRAVEVIGEANTKIKRKEDRIKGLENEKRELETKARVATRESQNMRTEMERLNEDKSSRAEKDAELRRSRDRKLKIMQEELESKEMMMADREIELRRRELELDQRMVQIRKQQADVERQLVALLDKEKSFEGRIHHQGKKDEELKRRDRALTVRESVIADKEDGMMRSLEDIKKNELNQKKIADNIARKIDGVNEMKKNNEDVAMKLAERKRELDKKEKELELVLTAYRRKEAEMSRKEESLQKRDDRLKEEQMDVREKQIEINQRGLSADMFEREKQQFNMEKQKWSAEAGRIRNELDNERRELRERELQLKAKERDQQLREKEWNAVKDALDKHLQEQEHIEHSIKAIEMEQERLETEQEYRERVLEKQMDQRQVDIMSSLSSKEGELVKRIGELQRKGQTIKTREARLKDDEVELLPRSFQVRRRPGIPAKSPPNDLSFDDVSESQTPAFSHPSKAHSHTPTDQRSTPESGFSDGQPGEYKILQRGPTSAHHRNQAFSIKTGTFRTLGEMKLHLAKQEGIPATWQQFYFNGMLVPDNTVLPPPENLVNGFLDLRLNVPRGNLPLVIRMTNVISRRIEFDANETIAAAKTRIYKSEGIPPHQQTIFCGDMELQDNLTLQDYQIQAGSELLLKVRYVVVVVIPNNGMLPIAVEDLDKVGSLKALIYEETSIHVDHQILAYGATTLVSQNRLIDYRIVEGSRIFVSYVIPIFMESNKETFTLSIDLQTEGRKIKEMIFKYRGIHPPLQNLVQHGRLLDDNVAMVDQLQNGGAVQLYNGNILILDESGKILDIDVQPWHNVSKIKERIFKKTGIQTRQQHLMHGDIELKTVNRSVKYFGVKRADILVLRSEPKAN